MKREDLTRRCKEAEQRRTDYLMAMDAIDGLGGFRPSLESLIEGTNGAVSRQSVVPQSQIWDPNERCYLDRHPREGDDKFARRRRASVYLNLVRRVHRIVIGFLFRSGPQRDLDGAHPRIKQFCDDVDGRGTPITKFDKERARIALQFGTCATLLNAPNTAGARTLADARQMSGGRMVWAENLYPEMLYDWRRDVDGRTLRVKVVDQYEEDTGFAQPARQVVRARELTRSTRTVWKMTQTTQAPIIVGSDGQPIYGGGDPVAETPIAHQLGEVPMVLAYFDKALSGGLLGVTPMAETCQLNRELYNTMSREGEHERGQVFALLVLQGNRGVRQTLVAVGTENALIVDPTCTLGPAYLAPPATVSATLEARIARFRRDIMHLWGLGWYDDPTGGPESGTAKEHRFQECDSNLTNFAGNLEESDRQIVEMALRYDGMSKQEAVNAMRSYKCQWPSSFNLHNLAEEIDRATRLLELPLDPVTQLAIATRLRDLVIELSPEDKTESNRLLAALYRKIGAPPTPDNEDQPPEDQDGQDASDEPSEPKS